MRFFQLSEIQAGISQPHVGEVVFHRGINVFFAFYIIPDSAVDQEGIAEIINILLDRIAADFLVLDRPEGCGKFFRVCQRTDCGG